ncbi:MAG: hypothetical protein ABI758_06150 [Candidatus Woesebacteria bacterium]
MKNQRALPFDANLVTGWLCRPVHIDALVKALAKEIGGTFATVTFGGVQQTVKILSVRTNHANTLQLNFPKGRVIIDIDLEDNEVARTQTGGVMIRSGNKVLMIENAEAPINMRFPSKEQI